MVNGDLSERLFSKDIAAAIIIRYRHVWSGGEANTLQRRCRLWRKNRHKRPWSLVGILGSSTHEGGRFPRCSRGYPLRTRFYDWREEYSRYWCAPELRYSIGYRHCSGHHGEGYNFFALFRVCGTMEVDGRPVNSRAANQSPVGAGHTVTAHRQRIGPATGISQARQGRRFSCA